MSKKIKPFTLDLGDGQSVTIDRVEEVDLDQSPIELPDGTVLDEAAAAQLGEEIAARAAAKRRGRPSLTSPGEESPRMTVRLSAGTKSWVVKYAKEHGKRPTDVVREAVEQYANSHR